VLAGVLDAKVVGNEAEGDVVALVTPEAGGLRRGGVAVFGKVGGEANVGNEACLFEAVHALANFHVHPPVWGDEGLQRVLLYDFVGNDAEGKSHVFAPFHWRVEVAILMLVTMKQASGVEIVLLMRHLAVVSLAVGVLTAPG
jgi:hypothetical protein